MTDHLRPDLSRLDTALDAYRRGSEAECDALFDEAMRTRQRSRVLRRLTEPRVLAFPGVAPAGDRRPEVATPRTASSGRWLGLTAAAGLVVGMVTGQMLPFEMPASSAPPPSGRSQTSPAMAGVAPVRQGPAAGGYVTTVALEGEDALLDAIEIAVAQQGPSELRALDDLTFQYDQR
jgi:hypothetical protein